MKTLSFLALFAALLLPAGAAMAKGHGQAKDNERGGSARAGEVRQDVEHRPALRAKHEPRKTRRGWTHGRKKGWADCKAAPGEAKKEGCVAHQHVARRGKRANGAAVAK